MVFICFAVSGDHTRLKIWYNPVIIRQYIHGKTVENHVLLKCEYFVFVNLLQGGIAMMGLIMCSGMATMMVPYSEGVGLKQFAWLGHSALIGGMLAPMAFMGGQLIIRAAWYTAGVVGGEFVTKI